MAKNDEKHTGAGDYTRPNADNVPDHVDTTYGTDQSAVSTDDSETVGAQAVADGKVQSTSGKGGTTSNTANPTPKLAKDATDHDPLSGAPTSGPVEGAPEQKGPPPAMTSGKFAVFTRVDGTRLAVVHWDVSEVSENADGTVTVVLPGRDLVSGPAMVNPIPSGAVRVTVNGPFDEVISALAKLDD